LRICQEEGLGEAGGTEIKGDTSAASVSLGYKGKKETKYMLMPHHMNAGSTIT
jgi:hypothetical protein